MCCDVGDMAIGYVASGASTYCDVGDMAMEYVETKSGTYTWHIDTWKSIGGIYQSHCCLEILYIAINILQVLFYLILVEIELCTFFREYIWILKHSLLLLILSEFYSKISSAYSIILIVCVCFWSPLALTKVNKYLSPSGR
jgi:hypothetical protein